MKHLIILFFATMLLISCKEKQVENTPTEAPVVKEDVKLTPELQNYENEIMKIHDEVMPKMSEVTRLSAQLRDIKEKGGTMDGLDAALEALNKAEQSMSDWMKNYSTVRPKLTERQLLPFFQKEVEKVTMVRTDRKSVV